MNTPLKPRVRLFALVLSVIVGLSTAAAFGQAVSGDLTGTVLDQSGAAVNGASVEATNNATGQKVVATTRGQGEYRFSQLPVGTYTIMVRAQGFKVTSLGSVPVDLNKTNTANVRLEVGASSTTVEVPAVAVPVDTTSAQIESVYDSRLSEDSGMSLGVAHLVAS